MKRKISAYGHTMESEAEMKDSLTHRAGLTFISQFLQQAARFIVGLIVTPIVIRGLGAELYGAWSMIQQSVGYLSLSDLKPMGTLKFILAVRQHIDDPAEKQRQIGAALLIWIFLFPFFLVLGCIAVWKLPLFIKINPAYLSQIQIAIAILIISAAIDRLLSLPANVLRGMNLEYKAMGLNSAIIIMNGGILVLAIQMGWELIGVAGASVLGIIISNLVRLFIAKRSLLWFGASKPSKKEFKKFVELSAWLTLLSLSGILLTASDFLLIGFILGPSHVAVYATTGAVLRMTMDPFSQFLSSANSGIAGICGQGDWKRAMKIRSEMFLIGASGAILIGGGIIALNKIFVSLWVGKEYFGGSSLNLFLVLAAVSRVFFQIDNIMLSGMLEIKRMAVSMCICGIIVITSGYLLISLWGISGMACATLTGYILQWIHYQFIIKQRSGVSLKPFCARLLKLIFAAVPIFIISYLGADFIIIQRWDYFTSLSVLIGFLMLSYIWLFIFNAYDRNNAVFRIKSFLADGGKER